jgi:hypothetical protein
MKIHRLVIRTLCLLGLGLQAHAQMDTVTYIYTDPQGTPLVKADAQGNVIARLTTMRWPRWAVRRTGRVIPGMRTTRRRD